MFNSKKKTSSVCALSKHRHNVKNSIKSLNVNNELFFVTVILKIIFLNEFLLLNKVGVKPTTQPQKSKLKN